jgi:hypothetical protein
MDTLTTPLICNACESPLPPWRFVGAFPFDGRRCGCSPPLDPVPVAADAMARLAFVPSIQALACVEEIQETVRSLGHAVRALAEIALLLDTSPLAAEIAERGLCEVSNEMLKGILSGDANRIGVVCA